MSKAHRTMTRAARATSAFLASAGMLWAVNTSAQADEESSEPQAGPAASTAPTATPAPAAPASATPPPATPTPRLEQVKRPPPSPSPSPAYPAGYPYTFQPKPQPPEPEGPITSWDPLRFAVAFESRTSWLRDDKAKRLVEQKRPSAVGVSLQADILRPRADVAVRLDLAWLGSSSSSYQSDSSLERLTSNLFSLGFALRYQLLRWLSPFARVSGGLGWDKLTVANLHDRQIFAHGSVGAGITLRSTGFRLWQGDHVPFLGLLGHLEGGYAMAAGGDFVLHADIPSSSDKPIPTSEVHLGRIERNAPYVRVALGLAF